MGQISREEAIKVIKRYCDRNIAFIKDQNYEGPCSNLCYWYAMLGQKCIFPENAVNMHTEMHT